MVSSACNAFGGLMKRVSSKLSCLSLLSMMVSTDIFFFSVNPGCGFASFTCLWVALLADKEFGFVYCIICL